MNRGHIDTAESAVRADLQRQKLFPVYSAELAILWLQLLTKQGKVTEALRVGEEAVQRIHALGHEPHGMLALYVELSEARVRAALESGAVDAAVLWDPDLALALRNVKGAHVVYSTRTATNLIFDVMVCDARLLARPEGQAVVQKFVAGWMAGVQGVRYDEIPIEPVYEAFEAALADQFKGYPVDASEENLQSRIRGTLLMAISNKTGFLVLTTGNKSEMTTGYATLYGDMAGGFGVLKDCDKELVYDLANWRNTLGRVIPERVITRAPSAELRNDQTDQDSLPEYPILDEIMALYMEQNLSAAEIKARGLPPADVDKVVRLLRINEYKRRQAPVGPRVTPRAYGRDWRYPITSGWRE